MNSHKQQLEMMVDIAANLKYAFSGPLGHHISGMIHYMEYVNNLADLRVNGETLERKDLLTKWFRIGITLCSTTDAIISFFAFNKIISQYTTQIEVFDEYRRHLWVSFSQEMVSFISSYDTEFIYILSHYRFDAKTKRRKSLH